MKSIVIFFSSLMLMTLINCGDSESAENGVEAKTNEEKQDLKITEKTIEELEYTDYVLSVEGEEAVANWEKYQELAIQINYLKKADLSFFNGDLSLLMEFVNEFKTSVPGNLQTNPIVSRVAIMETDLLKLNSNLTLDNIKPTDKLDSVKAVLIAFSNLNYQINKKLERDIYDKIRAE